MRAESARRWPQRLRRLVTTVPFLITVAVVAALAVAYTLAGFFLVPRLIRTYVPRYVQEQLKRRAEIGEVRLNPLLLKLEIKHFRLQEADGRPLLGFDRLFVDFELSSLFRRAWTVAEFQLEAPRLDVVLTRDGRLNLADLLDAFPQASVMVRAIVLSSVGVAQKDKLVATMAAATSVQANHRKSLLLIKLKYRFWFRHFEGISSYPVHNITPWRHPANIGVFAPTVKRST